MALERLSMEWRTKFLDWDLSISRGSVEVRSFARYLKYTNWYLSYISNYSGSAYSTISVQLHRDNHAKKLKVVGNCYISSENNISKAYLDCIMHSDVKHIEVYSSGRYIPKKNITIYLDAWITELTETGEKSVQTQPTFFKLPGDMHAMYQKQEHSDLTAICQDKEIRAHKCILSARSPVFAAILQHDTTENRDSRIVITDIEPDAFEELLQFLYCGKINPSTYSKACDLYYAADKYFVSDLKDQCRDFITSSLSTTSAVETLILADRHKNEELMQKAVTFITSSYQCIKSTEPWTILLQENPTLATKVLTLVEENSHAESHGDV
ncbi:speckle-type POZ protein-like [Stegodyphus dumicola]|uniref:speckle-type POZ protein-like n=1 Tax=Stegodyphus dumicola TaxID=202533 RepID=UPI0015B21AE8|nr:speckle-type POZ protein-like [Stegodyphus dumicola]